MDSSLRQPRTELLSLLDPVYALQSDPRNTEGLADQPRDEDLMSMLQNGNRDVIASLFRKHARAVRAVGKRILRDDAEAEDLVQEVFLYVLRKCSLFDPVKGSARSWLIQVAYTQALMRRRKLKSLGFYETVVPKEGPDVSSPPGHHTFSGVLGLRRRNGFGVRLSFDQQRVLRLHFIEGYTFQEIAGKLGQSYANVRNHYYRGLEKLRRHLAPGVANRR